MWLLDTSSGTFLHVDRPHEYRYAIFSHVWRSSGEQSFQDLRTLQLDADRKRSNLRHRLFPHKSPNDSALSKASDKIRGCCAIARRHGYRWVWIDSCCIDKTSSTELSEAINSMYDWYAAADICFAYLEDVDDHHDPRLKDSKFRRSRWFSRGWTLQELIAPAVVVFVSQTWQLIGTKADLGDLVEEITGVSRAILTHARALDSVSVAQRMSWASKRKTTREEDRAYSLMGIFGVNMPTIYGEGAHAFRRLQEEILRHIPDQTIFLWGPILHDDEVLYRNLDPNSTSDDGRYWQSRSLFAWSPDAFISSRDIASIPLEELERRIGIRSALPDYAVTSHGISTRLPVIPLHHGANKTTYLAVLASEDTEGRLLALLLYPQREGSDGRYYVGHYVGRPLVPPYVHYRAVALRSTDILRSIQVQDVCVPYRQMSLVLRPPTHPVSPPVFKCPCDIVMPGWVVTRLRQDGFSMTFTGGGGGNLTLHVTETTAPSESTLVLNGPNETIRIHMGRCSCVGRFLCVSVAGSGTPGPKRAATASTESTLVGPESLASMSSPGTTKRVAGVLTQSINPRCPTGHVATWHDGQKDFAYGLRRLRMTFSPWHARQDVYTLEVHLGRIEDETLALKMR